MTARIDPPMDQIEAFCRKWKIIELALVYDPVRFDDGTEFTDRVVMTFTPGVEWPSMWHRYNGLEDELDELFCRPMIMTTSKNARLTPVMAFRHADKRATIPTAVKVINHYGDEVLKVYRV